MSNAPHLPPPAPAAPATRRPHHGTSCPSTQLFTQISLGSSSLQSGFCCRVTHYSGLPWPPYINSGHPPCVSNPPLSLSLCPPSPHPFSLCSPHPILLCPMFLLALFTCWQCGHASPTRAGTLSSFSLLSLHLEQGLASSHCSINI